MAARRQLDCMSRALAAWHAHSWSARTRREHAAAAHAARQRRRLLQRTVLAWWWEAAATRKRATAAHAVWAFRLQSRVWAAWQRETSLSAAARAAEGAQEAMRRDRRRWEQAAAWHARSVQQRVWRVWRTRAVAWAEEVSAMQA